MGAIVVQTHGIMGLLVNVLNEDEDEDQSNPAELTLVFIELNST